jgi:hypothetical protein
VVNTRLIATLLLSDKLFLQMGSAVRIPSLSRVSRSTAQQDFQIYAVGKYGKMPVQGVESDSTGFRQANGLTFDTLSTGNPAGRLCCQSRNKSAPSAKLTGNIASGREQYVEAGKGGMILLANPEEQKISTRLRLL